MKSLPPRDPSGVHRELAQITCSNIGSMATRLYEHASTFQERLSVLETYGNLLIGLFDAEARHLNREVDEY